MVFVGSSKYRQQHKINHAQKCMASNKMYSSTHISPVLHLLTWDVLYQPSNFPFQELLEESIPTAHCCKVVGPQMHVPSFGNTGTNIP